jgi:hypothetical protein
MLSLNLDVALVTYSHSKINKKTGNEHIIDLDAIEIPEEIFMGGLIELLKLDSAWIPTSDTGSLYIRPFFFKHKNMITASFKVKHMLIALFNVETQICV